MGNIVTCIGLKETFRDKGVKVEREMHFSHDERTATIAMRGSESGLELERLLIEIHRQLKIDTTKHILCGWSTGSLLDVLKMLHWKFKSHVCRCMESHHSGTDARTSTHASLRPPLSLCHCGQGPT